MYPKYGNGSFSAEDESEQEYQNGNGYSSESDFESVSQNGSDSSYQRYETSSPEIDNNLSDVVDQLKADLANSNAQFGNRIHVLESELREVKKKVGIQAQVNATQTHLITNLAREVDRLNGELERNQQAIEELKGPQPCSSKSIKKETLKRKRDASSSSQASRNQQATAAELAPPLPKRVAADQTQQLASPRGSVHDDNDDDVIEIPVIRICEPPKTRLKCLEKDCDEVFGDSLHRNIHLNNAHGYTFQRGIFLCSKPDCNEQFTSREFLFNHKIKFHKQYQ